MYKCKVKIFLLSFGVLLFLATTSLGWDGPCTNFSACGGMGVRMGTCHYDEVTLDCVESCGLTCPEGSDDEYCEEESGSCSESEVHCTELQKYTCSIARGGENYCNCIDPEDSGYWCWRQDC